MGKRDPFWRWVLLAAAFGVFVVAGNLLHLRFPFGRDEPRGHINDYAAWRAEAVAKAKVEEQHIRKLGELARQYEVATGRPLRDLNALQDWAVSGGKATPDDFRSTRDGKNYELQMRGAEWKRIIEQDGWWLDDHEGGWYEVTWTKDHVEVEEFRPGASW